MQNNFYWYLIKNINIQAKKKTDKVYFEENLKMDATVVDRLKTG